MSLWTYLRGHPHRIVQDNVGPTWDFVEFAPRDGFEVELDDLDPETGLVIRSDQAPVPPELRCPGSDLTDVRSRDDQTASASSSLDMASSEEPEGGKNAPSGKRSRRRASKASKDERPGTPPNRELVASASDEDEADDVSEDEEENDDDDDDDGEEEEEEPKLKYARLTGNLGGLYRNGDATSAFLVAGDKMIVGTHNGNVHVLSLPSFQSIKLYHAHAASVTAISVSPFSVPLSIPDDKTPSSLQIPAQPSPGKSTGNTSSPSGKTKHQQIVPPTPSNMIHIATSSIDGKVCITSLVDPKDVLLRDFARPVQAVALSPEYKSDRAYLSGGLAGKLILTVGGRPGVSSKSIAGGAATATSGWLDSIGLGSGTEKESVLHSGEGGIRTIKWSPSGKYVVWINEQGIKIMRSNIRLESQDAEQAWKRISHVDRPDGPGWEEMSGVWKGHAEWIEDENLEPQEQPWMKVKETDTSDKEAAAAKMAPPVTPSKPAKKKKKPEKLVVGWGGTVWIMHVHPGGTGVGKHVGERIVGTAEIVAILRMDCIISGLSLYTPSLLLVLAYITPEDGASSPDGKKGSSKGKEIYKASPGTPSGGIRRRKNAVPPELRLIDLGTSEEVSADTLSVSRSESLSASDYHLAILPGHSANFKRAALPKGALEGLSDGLWSASKNATKIFTSAASMVGSSDGNSTTESTSKDNTAKASSTEASKTQSLLSTRSKAIHPAMTNPGMKIFIHSPYDCVLATTRETSDHLEWLLSLAKYEEAWNLVNNHPEAVSSLHVTPSTSTSSPPSIKRKSSSDSFYAENDTASTSTTATSSKVPPPNSAVEKEKRRIGELWLQQLLAASSPDWAVAGQICGLVLTTSARWEHWAWEFIRSNHFAELLPYIPTNTLRPPLPSLIYEVFLGHYISRDRLQFQSLLARWPPELFDVSSVVAAIQDKLSSNDITELTIEDGIPGRDWRILMEAQAQLLLADNRPREALRHYIRLQDADAAMRLISEYHLVDAVADDIPGLILLRVSKEQLKSAPKAELEEATREAITLLVEEAHHGVVRPSVVVSQLEKAGNLLFLFFYLKALWLGPSDPQQQPASLSASMVGTSKFNFASLRDSEDSNATDSSSAAGQALIEPFGDLALTLFAEYSRPLFMSFLRSAPSAYNFDHAYKLAETRRYIPEQVHLLSSTGQTSLALSLLISSLNDVSAAIEFCKAQNDPKLWDDLLDYSMDKPRFIVGLLKEVGESIDPVELVKRIPEGLEIEGLREGLVGLVKGLSGERGVVEGVARVLRGEVAVGMERLRGGRGRAVRVEVAAVKKHPVVASGDGDKGNEEEQTEEAKKGHCVICHKPFVVDEEDTLLAYPCGHTFHLACLLPRSSSDLSSPSSSRNPSPDPALLRRAMSPQPTNYTSFPPHTPHSSTFFNPLPEPETGVGAKIMRARLVRDRLARHRQRAGIEGEGCPAAVHRAGDGSAMGTMVRMGDGSGVRR